MAATLRPADVYAGREACAGFARRADWHAIRTRSSHEFVAARALRAAGLPEFLPYFTRLSQRADRRVNVARPLFSGYVFAYFAERDRARIYRAAGVAQVIEAPLAAADIAALMRATSDPASVEPAELPAFEHGERVTIARGPLAGLTGVVERRAGAWRLVITVEMIGRACAVEIGASEVIGRRR